MKFYIADAFTTEIFGGNPAGVVILDEDKDFPEAEIMRKTAAELRYSETAFIKPLHRAESDDCRQNSVDSPSPAYDQFRIRYFTPADEVDLCGHATIASFHCLKEAGLAKAGTRVLNKTLAGDLNIVIENDSILMDMAAPKYMGDIKEENAMRELYKIMGLSYEDNIPELERQCALSGGDGSGLKPEIISTGLPDIIMPVASREQLEKISPDFAALTELSRKYEVVGVHAFTLDGGQKRPLLENGKSASGNTHSYSHVTAFCRNFAPLYDIDEEAATGTSNGALTYYLLRNEVVIPRESPNMDKDSCGPAADCLFIQGEAMGRPSAIRSHTDGLNIQVGGTAVILAEGKINI
ncbi:MAG: PhzF family phenazine biosynthesis protein [Eubacteriales bacterium]|nr:PhzF family phenazine biosynthesis protein [Eubacteriales bacterium]